MIEWETVDGPGAWTADQTMVGGLVVLVCLDDEGPLRPAYYWDIGDGDSNRLADGWESSVARAKKVAVREARRLLIERMNA